MDLGFDSNGSLIVSCDRDGTVSIRSLPSGEEKHAFSVLGSPRACLSPVLDEYAVAAGGLDGKVDIFKKGWFGSKKIELTGAWARGDRGVRRVAWKGGLVAWTTAMGGLRIHDSRLDLVVLRVPREVDELRDDLVDSLVWETDEMLLVGWAQRVGIVRVSFESDPTAPRSGAVLLWLEMSCLVRHVAPFGGRNGRLAIFGDDGVVRLVDRRDGLVVSLLKLCDPSEDEEDNGTVRVAVAHDSYWNDTGNNNANTITPERDLLFPEQHRPSPRPLKRKTVQEETTLPFLYALLSKTISSVSESSELVIVRSKTIEDSLQKAIGEEDYQTALTIARGAYMEKWCSMSPQQVADAWLTRLIEKEDFPKLQIIMPQILSDDKEAWSRWCAVLAERRQLKRVVESLPNYMPSAVYDAALSEALLDERDDDYVALLRSFISLGIDGERAVGEINSAIAAKSSRQAKLAIALALAFSVVPNRTEEAFWAMLDAKSPDALDVLKRAGTTSSDRGDGVLENDGHRLLSKLIEKQRIADLARLDEEKSFELLSFLGPMTPYFESPELFLKSIIEPLCAVTPNLALRLLRKWNKKSDIVIRLGELSSSSSGASSNPSTANSAADTNVLRALHDLEVELCAKHDSSRFLELLRDSNGYSPDKALQTCKNHKPTSLWKPMVFLLQRIGGPKNLRDALAILTSTIGDFDGALELAEKENLFDELVRICANAPDEKLSHMLLSKAGGYSVDPTKIVRAIPMHAWNAEIKQHILQLFQDVRANRATRASANAVLFRDALDAVRVMHRGFRRGCKLVPEMDVCRLCAKPLREPSAPLEEGFVVFRTADAYHVDCLKRASSMLGPSALASSVSFEEVSSENVVKQHCALFSTEYLKNKAEVDVLVKSGRGAAGDHYE